MINPCQIEDILLPFLNEDEVLREFSLYSNFVLTQFLNKDNDEDDSERRDESERALISISQRMHVTIKVGTDIKIINILSKLKLDSKERFALIFMISYEVDPQIRTIWDSLFKSPITLKNIFLLHGFINDEALPKKENAYVSRDFALCITGGEAIRVNPILRMYIAKGRFPDIENNEALDPLLIYNEKEEEIVDMLKNHDDKHVVIHIYGEKNSGKKHFAKHLATDLDKKILTEKFDNLKYLGQENLEEKITKLKLFSLLEKGVVYISLSEKELGEKEQITLKYITDELHKVCPVLIVGGYSREDFDGRALSNFLSVELYHLSPEEKIHVWQHYKNIYQAEEELDVGKLGNKYVFNIGEIKNTYVGASIIAKNEIAEDDIFKSVKMRNFGLEGADLIQTKFTFKDLIVEEDIRRQLDHLTHQLQYKNILYNHWGFDKKIPYGRGISTLFYGPPGTGKTMAASVIANELGLDLYRIDISKLVSKYIGETEKNISTLFEKAKNMNVVLFFDEADALFAKRSEVKDSHDKNANAETAHLLQKLEEYEGVSILATNLFDQIDDAFRRRIKFMIPFKFPDEETRKKLWQSILPPENFIDEEIDVDFFAEKFQLSGSQIKEITLNACFIAVAQKQRLMNIHLAEAVTLNYQKYGKRLTKDDFGYLL